MATWPCHGFSITGNGRRVAESYDGDPEHAPELVVEYAEEVTTPGRFEAYNDFSWGAGQTDQNVTLYTTDSGLGTPPQGSSGPLVDYRSGELTSVSLTVQGRSVGWPNPCHQRLSS